MDISVSQLNHRLALQLPAELPLGLVFVMGVVRNLESGGEIVNGRPPFTTFDLEQKGHRLRCKLVQREAEKIALREQMEVRLGGHLTFDPRRAEYYLLARDAEVLSTGVAERKTDPLAVDLSELVEDQAAFSAALAGIKRRADVSRQASTDMPIWVQKIAPPELQASEKAEEPDEEVPVLAAQSATAVPLNDELVSYLSALMESEEEVELTPDILAQWTSAPEIDIPDDEDELVTAVPQPHAATIQPENEEEEGGVVTAVSPYDLVGDAASRPKPARARPPQPQPRQQPDWLVIILLIAMILFTMAICFAAVYLR
ncbi:MAG: hypothetical protein KJ069_25175 [Anaerolineae bacterium]|nr:hypothetical protein [Anaerolineae bacterium]